MKSYKNLFVLFAVVCLSVLSFSCSPDALDDDISVEVQNTTGNQGDDKPVRPGEGVD